MHLMSFQIYLDINEDLSQYSIAAGIYTTLMTLADVLQNPAIMSEAQQEVKKEESNIA
jgi:hypothetical protein